PSQPADPALKSHTRIARKKRSEREGMTNRAQRRSSSFAMSKGCGRTPARVVILSTTSPTDPSYFSRNENLAANKRYERESFMFIGSFGGETFRLLVLWLRCPAARLDSTHVRGVVGAQEFAAVHREFESILHAGFFEDVHQVHLHGTRRDVQRGRDF